MREFSLFKINSVTHHYWGKIVKPGDQIIDATCGNGHDTLALANLALTDHSGRVWAIDIQECALIQAKEFLKENLSVSCYSRIEFIQNSHATFPNSIVPNSISLIAYNLGYLPQNNKNITTQVDSTLRSVQAALPLIKEKGAISIICYPGHEEGKLEEEALLKELTTLPRDQWSCCYHRWLNHEKAPSLILIQKR